MAINYDKLIDKTEKNKWFTGKELQKIWRVDTKTRRARIGAMVKQGKFITRGKTANIQYKLVKVNILPTSTGNGVIDAKLRKEAGLPATPTSLEELINAATKIGSENEILKIALREAKAIIEKALEQLA